MSLRCFSSNCTLNLWSPSAAKAHLGLPQQCRSAGLGEAQPPETPCEITHQKGFAECSRRRKRGLENRDKRWHEKGTAPLFETHQGRLSSSKIVSYLLLLCYPSVSTCKPRSGREPGIAFPSVGVILCHG